MKPECLSEVQIPRPSPGSTHSESLESKLCIFNNLFSLFIPHPPWFLCIVKSDNHWHILVKICSIKQLSVLPYSHLWRFKSLLCIRGTWGTFKNTDPRLLPCKSEWGRDVSKLYDQNLEKVDFGWLLGAGGRGEMEWGRPVSLVLFETFLASSKSDSDILTLAFPRNNVRKHFICLWVLGRAACKSPDPRLGCIPSSDINSVSGLEVESPGLAKFYIYNE